MRLARSTWLRRLGVKRVLGLGCSYMGRGVMPGTPVLYCPTLRSEEPPMTLQHYNDSASSDSTKRYTIDLNDEECRLNAPHGRQHDGSGKQRTVDIREVLNAIFYRTRTGCQSRMLPSNVPAWYHLSQKKR